MSDKVMISDQRAFLIATMLRDQAKVLDERAESEHSAFALETVKRAASCRNMADDLEAAALAPASSDRAAAGEDWRTVLAVKQTANPERLTDEQISAMPDEELTARFRLMNAADEYGRALAMADPKSAVAQAYHEAVATLRNFTRPSAPAVAE